MISRGLFIETVDILCRDNIMQECQMAEVAEYFDVPTSRIRHRERNDSYGALLKLITVVMDDKNRLIEKWVTRDYLNDEKGILIANLHLDCGKEIQFHIQDANDLYNYFIAAHETKMSLPCKKDRKNLFCIMRKHCRE